MTSSSSCLTLFLTRLWVLQACRQGLSAQRYRNIEVRHAFLASTCLGGVALLYPLEVQPDTSETQAQEAGGALPSLSVVRQWVQRSRAHTAKLCGACHKCRIGNSRCHVSAVRRRRWGRRQAGGGGQAVPAPQTRTSSGTPTRTGTRCTRRLASAQVWSPFHLVSFPFSFGKHASSAQRTRTSSGAPQRAGTRCTRRPALAQVQFHC